MTAPVIPTGQSTAEPQGNLAHLFAVQGVALVKEHGEPICPSAVAQYLHSIDERLYMRAFPFPTGWEWAICEKWGPNDGRRQSIRSGETPADRDFDVVGYVPNALKIKTAEDAAAFLVAQLRGNLRSRPDFQNYLNAVAAHNEAQAERNTAPVREYAQELAEANTETMFADQGKTVTKVFQSEPTSQKGAKRSKGRAADIPSPK